MWTCINLQHKKLEKIFGYVLEYYGVGGWVQKHQNEEAAPFKTAPSEGASLQRWLK